MINFYRDTPSFNVHLGGTFSNCGTILNLSDSVISSWSGKLIPKYKYSLEMRGGARICGPKSLEKATNCIPLWESHKIY